MATAGACATIIRSDNPRSSAVCERIAMAFEREVIIPENERRAALRAKVYWAQRASWLRAARASGWIAP